MTKNKGNKTVIVEKIVTSPNTANKKKKKNKNKNKQQRMGMSVGYDSLHEKVCSQLDAFCPAAAGAKVYDTNSSRSATYQVRQTVPLVLDANGAAMYYFSSNPNYLYNTANSIVAGNVSTWVGGTANAFNIALGNVIGKWRVVSFGVHVMTTQSYNTAQGLYIVSDVTENSGASTGQSVGSFTNGQAANAVPVPGAEFFWTGRPTGMTATEYVEGYNTAVYNNYTQCLIGITGGTASAGTVVGLADICINYEWIPSNVAGGVVYNQITTPAAPSIPVVMDARANAASQVPTVVTSRGFSEYAKEILSKAETGLEIGMRTGRLLSNAIPMFRGYRMLGSAVQSMIMNR